MIVSRDVTFAEDETWSWSVVTHQDPQRQTIYVLEEEPTATDVQTEAIT